jgi:hypothetical protein
MGMPEVVSTFTAAENSAAGPREPSEAAHELWNDGSTSMRVRRKRGSAGSSLVSLDFDGSSISPTTTG